MVHSPENLPMTRPDPQQPPEHTLRRLSSTRLRGGTTKANRATDARSAASEAGTTSAAEKSGPAETVAPLLPNGARHPAAIAVACCAVVVGVLGVFAANSARGNGVDRPVDSWLRHNLAAHHRVVSDVANLGGSQIGIVIAAALVVACLLARRVNGAVLALASVLVSLGLTEFVL